ncbi:MAG: TIGR03620 family F420-dependent LLM class oxidoreductase [Streptosporangiales bacterium]|nr:TIGR03620 family F420-dependent LLM class oxidoreductase [Streptosporangiales bacterium]
MTTEELRSRLGRVGIWTPPPAATGQAPQALGQAIEKAGFTSVWVGGGNATPADFEALRGLLSGGERLIAAPGIANIWAWEPAEIRAQASRLDTEFPGRFILGVGVSHAPLVTKLGHEYVKPYSKMEKFLDELEHPAQQGGAAPVRELPPVVLAALGPKMLKLSARYAGSHPYFSPPAHTKKAREILGAGPLLVPEQAVSLASRPEEGRAAGRAYAGRYLKLPNYTRMLKDYGFTDEDIANGGSDRLIDAIIPSGAEAAAARVREHLDAGADHVVVQPLAEGGGFAFGDLGRLAEILA